MTVSLDRVRNLADNPIIYRQGYAEAARKCALFNDRENMYTLDYWGGGMFLTTMGKLYEDNVDLDTIADDDSVKN